MMIDFLIVWKIKFWGVSVFSLSHPAGTVVGRQFPKQFGMTLNRGRIYR